MWYTVRDNNKEYRRTMFASDWKSISSKMLCPLMINCGNIKAAIRSKPSSLLYDEPNKQTQTWFGVILHSPKDGDSMLVETRYTYANSWSLRREWKPVPFSVAKILFPDGSATISSPYTIDQSLNVFEHNGNLVLKIPYSKVGRWVYVADLAKNIIGKFFTNFGEEIAVAIRHGDKLSSMEDATNAADALMEIADSKYKIEYGWNLQRKHDIIKRIQEVKESIRRDEQNKDEVFNEAADAMNTLNEDFGIEIDF